MCGIFAYVGVKNTAARDVLAGLKLLEYRGYDSWGIAIRKDKKLIFEKHIGKIGNAKTILPKSNLGIGHTRWATHGGVTVVNAHPHLDCKHQLALVHNGIIENFQELKNELIKKGHVFLSETDTEVAVHLIEENLKKEGFATAVRNAFFRIKGFNAFVVVNAVSKEIIAVKSGSPIVAGIGKDGLYIASDVSGIIKHTRDIIFLEDNQMVILGDTLKLIQLPEGKEIVPEVRKITWTFENAGKGKYKHFMIKEIHEQPKIIRNIAETYEDQIKALASIVKNARGTFFIGAGTASFACQVGMYLLSHIAKRHVNTAPASEFNYLEDFLTKDSLIIPLSQSGETIDIVEPLIRAKEKGSKIAAITNVLGSTIYRMADFKMLLGAGPEKAVASTKAYTAKLAILWLLSHSLIDQYKKAKDMLFASAKEIERLLEKKNLKNIRQLARKLVCHKDIYVIGRGISSATALEGALKIKEVSYIHAEGLAGGELKHGTIALIDKGTPCIVLAPSDETYDAIISNATEIKARGGYIIGISSEKSQIYDEWIEVKEPVFSAITQVVVMQLLGYYLAVLKKLDPDKPRNLAKSVVVK